MDVNPQELRPITLTTDDYTKIIKAVELLGEVWEALDPLPMIGESNKISQVEDLLGEIISRGMPPITDRDIQDADELLSLLFPNQETSTPNEDEDDKLTLNEFFNKYFDVDIDFS